MSNLGDIISRAQERGWLTVGKFRQCAKGRGPAKPKKEGDESKVKEEDEEFEDEEE